MSHSQWWRSGSGPDVMPSSSVSRPEYSMLRNLFFYEPLGHWSQVKDRGDLSRATRSVTGGICGCVSLSLTASLSSPDSLPRRPPRHDDRLAYNNKAHDTPSPSTAH